jgi:hypothetical protein
VGVCGVRGVCGGGGEGQTQRRDKGRVIGGGVGAAGGWGGEMTDTEELGKERVTSVHGVL